MGCASNAPFDDLMRIRQNIVILMKSMKSVSLNLLHFVIIHDKSKRWENNYCSWIMNVGMKKDKIIIVLIVVKNIIGSQNGPTKWR